ncbi:uncharacterized protein LOC113560717 [Rhopalosiphum maidis]|uniref:uncharacterized protein LOC113560717 n=1 Tax=Rhopalosiphum maidis TaxID=43146 RepID=UPI000EFF63F4|nr:uncharacterized protein LOC113560717 [Rhopalosiphum maidis]
MSFLDIVSKFNQQADSHSKSQSLNPFSEQFEQSRSPSPRFSREEYGKPIAGSKTDLRGRKAKSHICREILELCTVIHDVGTYNTKKRDPDDDDEHCIDDGTIIVSFGELFQIYTKISDKVVGLLIAAKRRGFVYFDREILFQRRDDDVLIALLKPISEISKILKEDISQANSSAPVESKPVEKKKSPSSSKTKRVRPECNKEQNEMSSNHVTISDQPNAISEVTNGDTLVVEVGIDDDHKTNRDEPINVENVESNDGHSTNCNEQVDNNFDGGELVNNVIEISENMENQRIQVDDNMSEVVNGLVIDDEIKTKEIDGFDVVIENKSEVCDLASDDNSGEVRAEVENIQSETCVEINKTHTNDSQGDVTEESINNVVVSGSENNINNETEHICL